MLKFVSIRVLAVLLSVFVNFMLVGFNSVRTADDPTGLADPSQTARLTVTSYNIHSGTALIASDHAPITATLLKATDTH